MELLGAELSGAEFLLRNKDGEYFTVHAAETIKDIVAEAFEDGSLAIDFFGYGRASNH